MDHRTEARRDGHRWRARACALLAGIGTVTADDPQLTVREVETPRQPLRVIVDSRLETPRGAKILQGEKVLIFAAREAGARRMPRSWCCRMRAARSSCRACSRSLGGAA